MLRFLLPATVIMFLVSSSCACAQRGDVLPPVDMDTAKNNKLPEQMLSPGMSSGLAFKNEYIRENTDLQYQISLLEQMIKRQSNIARLSRIYSEFGLPFIPPPLPEGICGQLPGNIPCGDYLVSPYSAPNRELKVTLNTGSPSSYKAGESHEKKLEEFTWTDITCRGKDCSAVVISSEDPSGRNSVVTGDVLKDGSVVSEISFLGVKVERSGKEVTLMPSKASSEGGTASPLMKSVYSNSYNFEPEEQDRRTEDPSAVPARENK